MTVSDRIAVMKRGRIEQIGSAERDLQPPRTRFVSDFIGEINLFEGEWRDGAFVSNGRALPAQDRKSGCGTIAIRPERMRLDGEYGGTRAGGSKQGLRVGPDDLSRRNRRWPES